MKLNKLIVVSLIAFASSMAFANDECTQTCEKEYTECKTVAESPAAKQACEDDVKQCKVDCSN